MTQRNEHAYMALVNAAMVIGDRRPSRVGPTRSLFGWKSSFDLREGFPILTTRKIHWKPVLGELAAFLEAADHVTEFQVNGCNYWNADAARWDKGGRLGRIYGVQWRRWRTWDERDDTVHHTDQIAELIRWLWHDPFGRRHVITAWNPGELDQMALPPCHMFAQFYVDSSKTWLDCQVYMRSVDLCLGLPSDMVLYGALLHLVAEITLLKPRQLVFSFGDAHIYENHVEEWKAQRLALPLEPPQWYNPSGNNLNDFNPKLVTLEGYDFNPAAIHYPLNTTEVPNVSAGP